MTPRVLQLLLAPAIGGAETLACGLDAGLRDHGFDVRTAYLDPAGASSSPLARLRRLHALVRAERPDVILAHSALPNVYSRLVAGRRTPVVTVLHSASRDFDNPVLRHSERLLQRRTVSVVAVSRPQAEEYAAAFGAGRRVHIIPNGVRPDLPFLGLRDEKQPTTVVTLARINHQKDPATWHAAALMAVEVRPDLVFTWSGPASAVADQQRLVDAAEHPSVRWAGPTDDAGSVLARADIYFHPARAEAHPLAPLEAAAVGLPVVCSDAVARTLPAGLPVATFAVGDAEAAAAAILRVAGDLPGATRHATGWQAEVRRDFGLDRVCMAYADVLRGGLRRAPSDAPVATPIG